MKLRNKKTGEIVEYSKIGFYKPISSGSETFSPFCDSLAELNEEWEDYKPVEPIIDFYDERKLVRHWAEVHDVEEVWAHGIGDGKEVVEIYDVEDGLMRLTFYRPKKMEIDKAYTIDELCGEAPEPLEPLFVDLDERIKEKEEE